MSETLFEDKPMASELVQRPSEPTPMVLLQQAIDAGLNPDHLEKLMTLQERYERNQAEKQYADAMHACQADMPSIIRDAKNPKTHSMYARLETIQEVARPIYTKHGFSLSYGEADCPVEGFKRTVCDVRHVGGHCQRYHLDLPMDGIGPQGNPIGGMNRVQGCISTTSYGQRRLLCMIFNITIAGEDKDGNGRADFITQEQIAALNEWIESTDTNLDKFLNWFALEKLSDMRTDQFSAALMQLKRKAKR